ncbi:hypothetical protein [Actinoplanes sp. N902-109]|uniref:hypothetical protein n=1 Tax=Actinoplanes sp. (strain N902-109) TaxID=649831 RepID=UPI0012F85F39|nr:hypothetical protein [Actinoplanes sp. N902-109]
MASDLNKAYAAEFDRLRDDANYSAQAYFEAAKSSHFWARNIVFIPALASAIASLLVALGESKSWGAVSAVSAAIAATAAFLGTEKRATAFKESARAFTKIRHRALMEKNLALTSDDLTGVDGTIRSIWSEYNAVVDSSEPVPNRLFGRAQKRIKAGVLETTVDAASVAKGKARDAGGKAKSTIPDVK